MGSGTYRVKRCPRCTAACWETHRHCPACGADLAGVVATEGDPFVGSTIAGKYKIQELLGSGAMGRVYRADHLALDAQVAVKILNPDIANDPLTARRFHTEARAASRLRHPNAIAILDFGQTETGSLYLVMEMLRGRTLARLCEEDKRLEVRRAVDLLSQALGALDEAHAAGIIHRDFKPENIFVETLRTGRELVKVLDFGIAKLRGEAEAGATSRGTVCGTPEYMSPEQVRGEELDPRSDVYAAGIVLYELLTAKRPFEGNGPVIEILNAHLSHHPDSPRKHRPDLPPLLEQVCMRALEKDRERRYRSAGEMKVALEAAIRSITGALCATCGAPAPQSARFCPECGTTLRTVTAPTPEVGRVPTPSPTTGSIQNPIGASVPLPFIGRDEVLDRLVGLENHLVLVGSPGVGKSAVVEALAEREQLNRRKVVLARSDGSGAQVPWWPIRTMVATLLGISESPRPEEIDRATADHIADRAGIRELFGLGGVSTGLPLDVRRAETIAAVIGILRRSHALLLFEDVDRYDVPSRRLIAELISDSGRAIVLATAEHPDVLNADVEVLRLPPLDDRACQQLVQVGVPSTIIELAGAVPLYIEDWLLARREGLRDSAPHARAAVLSEDAHRLLDLFVVAGPEVPLPILASLAGVTDSGKALSELRSHCWLRPRAGRLESTATTRRSAYYESMPLERRRELHSQLGERLAREGFDPIVVAYHEYAAGSIDATAILERAGDAAREAFDDDAAVRWFRAALERARAHGANVEERAIVRIALKLAVVFRYKGDLELSERLLRDVLALAMRRGERAEQIGVLRALARLDLVKKQPVRAKEHLTSAIKVAFNDGDPGTMVDLYCELANVLTRLSDPGAAERELWEGLLLVTGGDGVDATEGPNQLWQMFAQLAQLVLESAGAADALPVAEAALRHAERAASPRAIARCRAFVGDCVEATGRGREAQQIRRRATDELRQIGDRRATAEMLLALAKTPSRSGRPSTDERSEPDSQRAWLKEAIQLADEVGWLEGVSRSRAALEALG